MQNFNVVMIVPTGIGAAVGGHSGDANPAARLLASVCDTLIVHPNVVNASDLNEMSDNTLYVEGSALDRFLDGELYLWPIRRNRVLVVCNNANDSIDPVNAARSTMGIDVTILELGTTLEMWGEINEKGLAAGRIVGDDELIDQVRRHINLFDTLAIHTPVTVDIDTGARYMREHGVNPWGFVEAMLSRRISKVLNMPVAHAPVEQGAFANFPTYDFPELGAEAHGSHLISVLRGLSRAPRLVHRQDHRTLSADDIGAMVTPMCWGVPHRLCVERGIPIIAVRENSTIVRDEFLKAKGHKHTGVIVVNNYHEAAGLLAGARLGLTPESMKRPLARTEIIK